jgi:hypothetical protein
MAAENSTTPAGGETRAVEIRFVSRRVAAEDAAAVTAVLLATIDEETSAAAAEGEPRRHPWVRSAGALRTSIDVGHGRWQRAGR